MKKQIKKLPTNYLFSTHHTYKNGDQVLKRRKLRCERIELKFSLEREREREKERENQEF